MYHGQRSAFASSLLHVVFVGWVWRVIDNNSNTQKLVVQRIGTRANYSLVVSINVIFSAQRPTKRRRCVHQIFSRRWRDEVMTTRSNRSWWRITYLKNDKEEEETNGLHVPSSKFPSLCLSSYQHLSHLRETRNRRTWTEKEKKEENLFGQLFVLWVKI